MNNRARALLNAVGKGERKVIAVFGYAPEDCHHAVVHVREGAPDVPVWLFATREPMAETAALCERVVVRRNSVALLLQAQRELWPYWVALGVSPWTGGHGKWALKLAPFLIPPFRALLLNKSGDFFRGTPGNVAVHGWHLVLGAGRAVRDLVVNAGWLIRDVGRGLWRLACVSGLLIAATLLRWCGYPDRRLFNRLHGGESLGLSVPPGGEGVARYAHKGAYWDGREFEKFARSSNARWILWDEEACGAEDLLPLVEDERTFAVSRQQYFRAWHPMVIPIAPFAPLAPGARSQVLAPVSRAILVDRRKLLALGIPRCSLAGAAWLIIFWKAAAAGWRSYSVGHSGPVTLHRDFPMQERAFIFHVLWDPALRRLGPREPNLSRGNILGTEYSIPDCEVRNRGLSTPSPKLRVLIVSPFLPYPLSHGGAVRIYNLCRALRDRVDFTLAAIREEGETVRFDKLHEVFREVYILDKDEHASKDEALPAQVREHQSRSLRALIAELARRSDLIQIEYTHLAAFRDSAPEVPAVLVEHDLTFSLYSQLARSKPSPAASREYERWLAFERKWLGAYDAVWTMSDEDCEAAVREGSRRADRTFAIPNGVDVERWVPCESPASAEELLYVGSFRHLPNILGFEKLCQEVMPRVWNRNPDVRLRVVAGPEHEHFWQKFGRHGKPGSHDHRIEMHGFIEDLRPLYAKASVVVVPLEVSAGTNIKVLEAMACGKAIVTTPVGCAGLGLEDGSDALIHEDWGDFARSVSELLADPALRSRLAAQARRTAEARFSWTAVAERAYQSYVVLAGRS